MTMDHTSSASRASSPNRTPMSKTNSKMPMREGFNKSVTRSPLQEKSSSETNVEASGRGKEKLRDLYNFSATPFPTKPQHILLPSTVRKQKSFQVPQSNLFIRNHDDSIRQDGSLSDAELGTPGSTRVLPVIQLKKSVTTLRDMYEEQERSSRPSTAASLQIRPTTSSSRLRSASSSDGFSGRYAWETLHKVSSDDMALLPSLNEAMLRKISSDQSLASGAVQNQPLTSSPNFRIYATSSPRLPVFRDEPILTSETSEASGQLSSFGMSQNVASSPNFIRLGRSSSFGDGATTLDSSSSPNFVKLGSSSPQQQGRVSPTPSTSSSGSLKRKRGDTLERPTRSVQARLFNSSPPYMTQIASSSEPSLKSPNSDHFPSPDSFNIRSQTGSSPVFRLFARNRHGSDSSSVSSNAHSSLQAALSSSPMAPIQYPVIRAPASSSQSLMIPKRGRVGQLDSVPSTNRLSPMPSEWFERNRTSRILEELEEELAESITSLHNMSEANESQVRIIPDDDHEASDELSALPRGVAYRSPPMVPVRSNSLYGTLSTSSATQSQSRLNSLRHSMDSRLNSMKSYTHSRRDSVMSNTMRPSSAASTNTNIVVPTWARRYYSGVYRDSFQYLYPPSQNNSTTQLSITKSHQTYNRQYLDTNSAPNAQPSGRASRSSRHSFQSIRDSLRDSIIERFPKVIRPRLEARKSHMMAGIGPLVSHPVRPESAILHHERRPQSPTIRYVSDALPPSDPRAHWAGLDEQQSAYTQHQVRPAEFQQAYTAASDSGSSHYNRDGIHHHASGLSRFSFMPVPHLHHDRRLNTGSSISRGYGFPFNRNNRFGPPSVNGASFKFQPNLRTFQKLAFILGFLCPLSWFVASALPLPTRPVEYVDIEKAEWDAATNNGSRQLGQYEEMDVVARLRMERHVKGMEELEWQNARWWRHMNRVMSVVGVVIIILIIVLAIIGTRNRW